MRRSPIGDLVLNIIPGHGTALPDGAMISTRYTTPPPDAEKTIEALARVLHAVPSQDLGSLVNTLAIALNGRGQDLASLAESTADLPTRILQVRDQLRSLIENGPSVTGVLAQNADALANDVAQTALLAEILRDRRYDLLALERNGARFSQVANDIVGSQKANLACLINDLGTVNATIAEPKHLRDLESTLDLNHYFFDAVWQSVQPGRDGLDWFRVHLLPPQQPPGQQYPRPRPPPSIYPGLPCVNRYGRGVAGVNQRVFFVATGSHVIFGR
jgi:virulence factor Mce-like protein